MRWQLLTEASPTVGLGHLSRMCGLAQALEDLGQEVVLRVWTGTVKHLVNTVGEEAARTEWLTVPYGLWSDVWLRNGGLSDGSNVVFDTYNGRYTDTLSTGSRTVTFKAIMTDFGFLVMADDRDVLIRPHDTDMDFTHAACVVLAGVRYHPLRHPYWISSDHDPVGSNWIDPRLRQELGTTNHVATLREAGNVFTYVGVQMYESIALGRRTYVVARNTEELGLTATLPVRACLEKDAAAVFGFEAQATDGWHQAPTPSDDFAATVRGGAHELAAALVRLA